MINQNLPRGKSHGAFAHTTKVAKRRFFMLFLNVSVSNTQRVQAPSDSRGAAPDLPWGEPHLQPVPEAALLPMPKVGP